MKRNKQHRGLPENWRIKHGSYRYRVPKGMEHLWDGKGEFILGRTYSQALTVYAGRIASLDGAIRSFSHLIDRYSLEVTTTKAPATQKEEVRHLKKIREMIGDNDVELFEPVHAYQMRDLILSQTKRGSGENYANKIMGVVKHLCTKAIEWGVIKTHPMTEGKFRMLPKPKKRQIKMATSIQQVVDAMEFCPPWLQGYVRLKLATGLRQFDMLHLTRHCITEEGLLVTHSKTEDSTGTTTLFEWTPELRKIIGDVCAITPTSVLLFKNQKGEPLIKNRKTNSAFASAWARWMKRLRDRNIKRFSERSLRNLVGSEDDLQTASERLGHASTTTTQQYYRNKPTVVLPLAHTNQP
jgi:integrase